MPHKIINTIAGMAVLVLMVTSCTSVDTSKRVVESEVLKNAALMAITEFKGGNVMTDIELASMSKQLRDSAPWSIRATEGEDRLFRRGIFDDEGNQRKLDRILKRLDGEPLPQILQHLITKYRQGTLEGAQLEFAVRFPKQSK